MATPDGQPLVPARAGIEPATSWFLDGFVNHCATTETPPYIFRQDETSLNSLLLIKTVVQISLDLRRNSLGFVTVLNQPVPTGNWPKHFPAAFSPTTQGDFKDQMCLRNLKLLLLISHGCRCLHSEFNRDLSEDISEWLKQTWRSGNLSAFSFLLISNFNPSHLSHVGSQRAGWCKQLCWNSYEEDFYRTCSPVSWQRTRNPFRGFSFIPESAGTWDKPLSQQTGILSERSNLSICLVGMAWFSWVLGKPRRSWTSGLSAPCSWGQEGEREGDHLEGRPLSPPASN